MSYGLYTTPSGRKSLKKLSKSVRKHLLKAVTDIGNNPQQHPKLRTPWTFLRSFHTRYQNSDYRIVYEIITTKKQIVVHYADTRENFYQKLRRLRLKPETS